MILLLYRFLNGRNFFGFNPCNFFQDIVKILGNMKYFISYGHKMMISLYEQNFRFNKKFHTHLSKIASSDSCASKLHLASTACLLAMFSSHAQGEQVQNSEKISKTRLFRYFRWLFLFISFKSSLFL